MTTFNQMMTVMGYVYTSLLGIHYSLKGYLRLKLWHRKRRFEKLHGKHSYGAVTYLAGIKKLLEEHEKED